jgi:hypothetical protein
VTPRRVTIDVSTWRHRETKKRQGRNQRSSRNDGTRPATRQPESLSATLAERVIARQIWHLPEW